jgi:hypothetical protein
MEDQMGKVSGQHRSDQRHRALGTWDDEGGAASSSAGAENTTNGTEQLSRDEAQKATDTSYESATRGEHRYPDSGQRASEREARDERDVLKRKLRDAGSTADRQRDPGAAGGAAASGGTGARATARKPRPGPAGK